MTNSVEQIISRDQYSSIVETQNATELVLKTEIQRLDSKKNNMDEKEQNARRMILMTRSYRDKQAAYLMILSIMVLSFGIGLCIVFLQERIGISNVFLDGLLIGIVTLGIVISILLYFDIKRRDKIDFSKLDSTQLESVSKDNQFQKSAEKGDLSSMAAALCRGSECCGPGFEYKEQENTCVLYEK